MGLKFYFPNPQPTLVLGGLVHNPVPDPLPQPLRARAGVGWGGGGGYLSSPAHLAGPERAGSRTPVSHLRLASAPSWQLSGRLVRKQTDALSFLVLQRPGETEGHWCSCSTQWSYLDQEPQAWERPPNTKLSKIPVPGMC